MKYTQHRHKFRLRPEINFRAGSNIRLKPAIFYSPLQRGSGFQPGDLSLLAFFPNYDF